MKVVGVFRFSRRFSSSTQARVNKKTGSDIAGVPASEIKAMFPAFNLEMRFRQFCSVVHVMAVHVCNFEMQ
jgi:hypothetical protein